MEAIIPAEILNWFAGVPETTWVWARFVTVIWFAIGFVYYCVMCYKDFQTRKRSDRWFVMLSNWHFIPFGPLYLILLAFGLLIMVATPF